MGVDTIVIQVMQKIPGCTHSKILSPAVRKIRFYMRGDGRAGNAQGAVPERDHGTGQTPATQARPGTAVKDSGQFSGVRKGLGHLP